MRRIGHVVALSIGVFVLVAILTLHAKAETLAHERFDYPISANVAGRDGGIGWGGPWTGLSGAARIVASNECVQNVPVFGNEITLDGNTRVMRRLDVIEGGAFDRAGLVEDGRIGRNATTLYVGFRQRISREPSDKPHEPAYLRYYAFEFNTSGSDQVRVLEIGHDDRSNRPSGPYYGAASVANNGRDDHEPGQFRALGEQNMSSNLIVVKFTFGSGDRDTVQVFRNPASTTEESKSTVDATLEGNFTFDRIALARFVGNDPVHSIDEIRFGTQYSDVFPRFGDKEVRAAFTRAEEQLRQQAAVCQTTIKSLAARGRDTAGWQAQLDALSAPDSLLSPWERLDSLDKLRQAIEVAGLELGIDRLLFVKRHMFRPTHIYTEVSDGPFLPGGGIFVLSPVHPDGEVTMLFDAASGIVRDPDVSFDGKRVLFSYRPSEDGYYHIFEMNVDGSGLRQITDGSFHDLDPFYLPDGRIGFTSTRCRSRALCFWVRAATLFVMNADGSDVQPLTANNVNEFTPQMLPDGRILYTRWEYMDKSAIFVQSLWSINPDGTRAQQVFGNNLIHPVSLLQARLIPGTKKMACIMGAHNGDSVGPLAVVDPSLGVNNSDGILDLTPKCDYHSGCCAPYPIDDQWCLVSYGPQEPFGIYAFHIDPPSEAISARRVAVPPQAPQHPRDLSQYFRTAIGKRVLLYRDEVYSSVEAIPVRARELPKCVASSDVSSGEEATQQGTLLLVDVNLGLGESVRRGEAPVKYLRVVEEMGHRDVSGQRDYEGAFDHAEFQRTRAANFMSLYASPWESGKPAPSLQAKYVYGTVPVEPDGSAYFNVPADRPIYFQALDENYNEIQRMRSYIHLKPGERLSCIGCHEHRQTSPPLRNDHLPMALACGPNPIEPPPFSAGPFAYQKLVQPIFGKRCASCHGAEKPAGDVNLTGRLDGRGVPASFTSLVRPRTNPNRPPLVNFFDNWWGVSTTVPIADPGTFGTLASRLIQVIDNGHEGMAISDDERAQIVLTPSERRILTTWIDLNCPLWDNYCPECRLAGD